MCVVSVSYRLRLQNVMTQNQAAVCEQPDQIAGDNVVEEQDGIDDQIIDLVMPYAIPFPSPEEQTGPKGPSSVKFAEDGFGQLTKWIGDALLRLPDDMRKTLTLYHRAHPGPLQVGSACSGTDAPILVVRAYAEAVRTHLNVHVEVEHTFPGLPYL